MLHILAFSRPMAVRGPAMAPRLPKGPKRAEGPNERPKRVPIREKVQVGLFLSRRATSNVVLVGIGLHVSARVGGRDLLFCFVHAD